MITGNEMPHKIESLVSLVCSSDLAVQAIRWLNDSANGQELLNNTGQQQLILTTKVVRSTSYTCEMQVFLFNGFTVLQETTTVYST